MLIQEEYLDYIWKFQYFDQVHLTTSQGESLIILDPGIRNEHAGPDFMDAHIRIENIDWYGHVELHTHASAWHTHQHHLDPAYENVILHVVWYDDQPIQRADKTSLPTVSLAHRVAPALLKQCAQLIEQQTDIPCERQLTQVSTLIQHTMLDRVLFQRLSHKNALVYQLLSNNQGNWEETAYQLLAYNFGFKVNSAAMLAMCATLPYKVIQQQRADITQVEALLLGQAGLLEVATPAAPAAEYRFTLLQHHAYLSHKYQLPTQRVTQVHWKFFRLRPANFPTIRIAQLAQVLHQQDHLFNWLLHTPLSTLRNQLAITQSNYWQHHYTFGKVSKKQLSGLGDSSINIILINTVVPLLVAYGKTHDQTDYIDRALEMLHSLPPEDNTVIRRWKKLGMKIENAFDSQALIELYHHFCTQKKCLSCNIGTTLLQRAMPRS
jgi:hypothetical protein